VTRCLESLREAGRIGAGLEAAVTIHADGELAAELASLGDELRFVFITSGAAVAPLDSRPADAVPGPGCYVSAAPVDDPKCVRCWHRLPDVGSVPGHPEACARCATNVDGPGEARRFV
jgi:isoleucyl-tRNA synthetase